MRIGIANDHRGYETKKILTKYLIDKGYNVINYGTDSLDRTDYTKYGFLLGEAIQKKEIDYGIAICGSAIGISIACNKVKGVRCGKLNSVAEAIHGKERDFINIAAISGESPIDLNISIVEAFINAKENVLDNTYMNRVKQIEEYEK